MTTELTKPISRLSSVVKQGKRLVVTLDETDVITLRRQRSTFKLRLNIGQAYDYAAKLAAYELSKLKKQLKQAKKDERYADVMELQDKIRNLGK